MFYTPLIKNHGTVMNYVVAISLLIFKSRKTQLSQFFKKNLKVNVNTLLLFIPENNC